MILSLMKKVILLLIFAVSLVACSNEDTLHTEDVAKQEKTVSFKVSEDDAKAELRNFLNNLHSTQATTRSTSQIEFADVQVVRNNAVTRAGSTSEGFDVGLDTLVYAINFANNQGFALVAADKRTSPILAIADEGSFSIENLSEDKDEGFLSFLDNALKMEVNDIKNYNNTPQTRSTVTNGYVISSIYSPILHTRWTQQGIYGRYCPNGIAGCVMIATAQILSVYKTLGHVNWAYNGTMGASDLHWDKILSDCDNYNGNLTENTGNEIAHLVRYLGIALDADYKKSSTGAKSSKAVDWFNKWGGLKASSLKDYNESNIIDAIKSGYPVFASGYSGKKRFLGIRVGYKGAHAWVYDGLIVATKDNKTYNLVHCNWGWGGYKNGYYLSKAFGTNAGATIYDSSDIQAGSSSNYKYNLEYSIVRK